MKYSLTVLVLGFLISIVSGQTTNCSRSVLDHCAEEINKPYGLKAPGLVFTEEQIKEACSPLFEAQECIKKYNENCVDASSRGNPEYNPAVNPSSLSQIVICEFLINNYIQYFNCYVGLNDTYVKCVEAESEHSFRDNVEKITGGNKELQQEGCCNIYEVFECALAPTRKSCGLAPASTLEEFIKMPIQNTIIPICQKFNCTTEEISPPRGPSYDHPEREDNTIGKAKNGANIRGGSVGLCIIVVVALNYLKL